MTLAELLVTFPLVSSGIPSFQAVAIYLTIGLLSWYIISCLTAWYRLKDFPGPLTTGFSNLWAARAIYSGKPDKIFVEAQEKYGPVTRIGPNALMYCDAATYVSTNAVRSSYVRGKEFYDILRFDPYDHTVISESNSARHHDRRTMLYAGYQGKGEIDLEKDVDLVVAEAVNLIRTKYMKTSTSGPKPLLDFARMGRHIAVDSITLTGLGKAWGDVRDEKDHFDWLALIEGTIREFNSMSYFPALSRIVFSPPLLALAGPKPTDKTGIGAFLG